MINPVHSSSTAYAASTSRGNPSKPAAQPKKNPPQDTVQLSPRAKAAAGDADHDGDSH
jgi:hypothetical protein